MDSVTSFHANARIWGRKGAEPGILLTLCNPRPARKSRANGLHTLPQMSPAVMLVERHADTREMYVEALSSAGFSTVEATNAEYARRRAEVIRPVAIITDLRLAEAADGLELCEKLKEHPLTKDIPMIVVADFIEDRKLRARVDAVGCAAVLLKPVAPETLVSVVRTVVPPQSASE